MPDYQPGPHDIAFLHLLEEAIRNASADKDDIDLLFTQTRFPQRFCRLILVLYAPRQKRILISRTDLDGKTDFADALERLLLHPRLEQLASQAFHLQMDFMVEPPAEVDFTP